MPDVYRVIYGILSGLILINSSLAQGDGTGINAGFQPPQAIDGSRRSGTNRAASEVQAANSQVDSLTAGDPGTTSQGQRIFDALFNELDNMIPGEFAADSEQKKAVEDAVTAFQIQDVKRVNEILNDLAAKNPNYPPADLLLAALSYAVKDVETGLLLLERAAVEHPGYPGVYSAFARLAINQGRVTDALALFEKCDRKIGSAELDPVAREYFEQQCLDGLIDVAMRQKRYDDARGYLEHQKNALPDNAKVLFTSAELEFNQNNVDKSLEFLQSLRSKFPTSRVPESVLASWFQQTGKKDEAETWIRAAAEKYPNDAQVQFEFASWAVNEEDFPTASSAIIKAEKASSENLFSRNLKGKIAFANQSYGVAESHFRTIAEAQPSNFDAVNMYALSLIESNDPEKQKLARQVALKNFRSLPDNLVAQAALGYVELKLGQTEQAKSILTPAARTPGTAPEIDFFLASLLEKLGEPKQAQMVLESAIKQDGIFLYRSAAKQLLEKLKASSDSIPEPGK